MIIFSAITPHPPVLIPAIGKENLASLKTTSKSFERLEEDLYASQAETIVIISPHGLLYPDAFTMNLGPKFEIKFENFGDFSTKFIIKGDVGLGHRIRESLETKAPLQMTSEKVLDHGCGVPLYLLTHKLKGIKVIPLYYSGLNLEAHFKFGQMLKREFLVNKERIAIIASGDLSHRLNKNAPAGYSPKAGKFDKRLIENLKNKKTQNILATKEKLVNEVRECGLKSIVILLGILDGINYEPQILSYEAPFGVGYLTMNFKL